MRAAAATLPGVALSEFLFGARHKLHFKTTPNRGSTVEGALTMRDMASPEVDHVSPWSFVLEDRTAESQCG